MEVLVGGKTTAATTTTYVTKTDKEKEDEFIKFLIYPLLKKKPKQEVKNDNIV
jgi:hypothetical protein